MLQMMAMLITDAQLRQWDPPVGPHLNISGCIVPLQAPLRGGIKFANTTMHIPMEDYDQVTDAGHEMFGKFPYISGRHLPGEYGHMAEKKPEVRADTRANQWRIRTQTPRLGSMVAWRKT